MKFDMETQDMKKGTFKLTLTAEGPFDVITRIEQAIHESLGSQQLTINFDKSHISPLLKESIPGTMEFSIENRAQDAPEK
jgi:hypothetical protein